METRKPYETLSVEEKRRRAAAEETKRFENLDERKARKFEGPPPRKKKKILLVQASEEEIENAKEVLERRGLKVFVVESTEEAKKVIEKFAQGDL